MMKVVDHETQDWRWISQAFSSANSACEWRACFHIQFTDLQGSFSLQTGKLRSTLRCLFQDGKAVGRRWWLFRRPWKPLRDDRWWWRRIRCGTHRECSRVHRRDNQKTTQTSQMGNGLRGFRSQALRPKSVEAASLFHLLAPQQGGMGCPLFYAGGSFGIKDVPYHGPLEVLLEEFATFSPLS